MPFDGATPGFAPTDTVWPPTSLASITRPGGRRFDPELRCLYDRVARATADRRPELGLRNGQWYERWADFAVLDADFGRVWVPGWRRWPAPLVNGFVEVVDEARAPFTGIGRRIREMHCEHSADTIRLSLGRRRRRNRPGGPIKAITPPNEIAVGLARTITTAFPVTIVHSEETFDFFLADDGNDSLDGETPATAWRTPARLQTATAGFAPGTSVGSKRGSRFTDMFVPQSSGTSGNPITYGAYDAGVIPRFDGDHGGNLSTNSNKSFLSFEFLRVEQWNSPWVFSGCPDLVFTTCDVLDIAAGAGLKLESGSDDTLVDGGNYSDNGPNNAGTDSHGINCISSDDLTVQNIIGNRNTADGVQAGNVKPVNAVTVSNCVLNNNGENACDLKDGAWTIEDVTGLFDGVGGFAIVTRPVVKGVTLHDQSSDAPSPSTITDSVFKGWGNNQIWMDNGKHTVTINRCFLDDDAGLGVAETGYTLDINGNASPLQESTCTVIASLIVGRQTTRGPCRIVRSVAATFQHTTFVCTVGSQDVFDQDSANAQNVLKENCIYYHKGTGLALDINGTSDIDGITDSVFDTAGSNFVGYGGSTFTSGQAGSFNSEANVSGNVFGDPVFTDDDGTTIASYTPGSGGTAHRLGAASVTALDINGAAYSTSPLPTAGCIQRSPA